MFEAESQELAVQRRFLEFLLQFRLTDPETNQDTIYYMVQAANMVVNDRTTLYFNFDHLRQHEQYADLAVMIMLDYYRYEPNLRKAVQELLFRASNESQEGRVFYLGIYNTPSVDKIRDLRACKIGQLFAFQGTVTRSSEVRPELISATFICQMCAKQIENVEQQFKYTTPKKCTNPRCDNRTKWTLDLGQSLFADFQKVRVQEDPKEIPAGSMPRSIDVILHNDICDAARPGDKCTFTGCLTVVPDIYSLSKPGERSTLSKGTVGDQVRGQTQDGITGLKNLGVRDLAYKHVFVANFVESVSSRFNLLKKRDENTNDDEEETDFVPFLPNEERKTDKRLERFSQQDLLEIEQMKQTPDLYKNLAQSIAPAVTGHDEVKKGILLMLLGGVNKKTNEGVNIRGDINLCIVGDPACAKSQFLKFVCSFLPRSVYTSGKASSAAGLTASVHRDPETGEFCIEAGALMLADHGVCCIDEFDKMESKDQVAIHEAMEQQTISLAKAGIHATLNARASILAAANPIYGRYDRSKSLKFNVNMTQPIMSRFDLFFVITDQSLEYVDQQIAQHIVRLHSQLENALDPTFSTDQLRRYIDYAQTFVKPIFTTKASQYLKHAYIRLRQNDQITNKASYRITVRQLESLIRLSEAIAKVYLDDEIKEAYVKEAERLLSHSQINIERPEVEVADLDDEMEKENFPITDGIIQQELRQREEEAKAKRRKIHLASDDYHEIRSSIIAYMKQAKSRMDEEISENLGVVQQDIVDWYCDQRQDQLTSGDDVSTMARLIHTIIGNLIKTEKLLVIVKDDRDTSQRQLQLHSNYAD